MSNTLFTQGLTFLQPGPGGLPFSCQGMSAYALPVAAVAFDSATEETYLQRFAAQVATVAFIATLQNLTCSDSITAKPSCNSVSDAVTYNSTVPGFLSGCTPLPPSPPAPPSPPPPPACLVLVTLERASGGLTHANCVVLASQLTSLFLAAGTIFPFTCLSADGAPPTDAVAAAAQLPSAAAESALLSLMAASVAPGLSSVALAFNLTCGDTLTADPGCSSALPLSFGYWTPGFYPASALCLTPPAPPPSPRPPPPPLPPPPAVCRVQVVVSRLSGGLTAATCASMISLIQYGPWFTGLTTYGASLPGLNSSWTCVTVEDTYMIAAATLPDSATEAAFMYNFKTLTYVVNVFIATFSLVCGDTIYSQPGCDQGLAYTYGPLAPNATDLWGSGCGKPPAPPPPPSFMPVPAPPGSAPDKLQVTISGIPWLQGTTTQAASVTCPTLVDGLWKTMLFSSQVGASGLSVDGAGSTTCIPTGSVDAATLTYQLTVLLSGPSYLPGATEVLPSSLDVFIYLTQLPCNTTIRVQGLTSPRTDFTMVCDVPAAGILPGTVRNMPQLCCSSP